MTNIGAAALRALSRQTAAVIAGVAVQAAAAQMVGEGQIAARTAQHKAAVPAEHIRGRPAPVEVQNCLLSSLQGVRQSLLQGL